MKFFDRINDLMAGLAGALILFGILLVAYSITSRYFHFGYPIWGTQVVEYTLVWITFGGAAWLLKQGGHVRIDVLTSRLSGRTNSIVNLLDSILGLLACGVLAWISSRLVWSFWQRGIFDVRAIDIPKFVVMLIIPFGSLLLVLQFIEDILLKRWKA